MGETVEEGDEGEMTGVGEEEGGGGKGKEEREGGEGERAKPMEETGEQAQTRYNSPTNHENVLYLSANVRHFPVYSAIAQ